MKKMKRDIHQSMKTGTNIRTVYTSTKLSSKFSTKDKMKKEHLHNVTYLIRCPDKTCKSKYAGQTKCRMKKRTTEHNESDKKSHMFIHSEQTKHKKVEIEDISILGKRYTSDFKRKISESLFIKELKPDLNTQKDSYKLKLFN